LWHVTQYWFSVVRVVRTSDELVCAAVTGAGPDVGTDVCAAVTVTASQIDEIPSIRTVFDKQAILYEPLRKSERL
jgi:hypothetical protein